jgi:cellulose synthase/poly-beta-1,6-N-acetylglucosamine synthase-like glycosyltransferase
LDEIPVVETSAVALVPALNEEWGIAKTVDTLMDQAELDFMYVLVIANNCTDNTASIVESLQLKYGEDKLRLIVMENNKGLKAGALNEGFRYVLAQPEQPAFIFSMDGDTIVHEKILSEGVKKFAREHNTGGICSAYRTMPLKKLEERDGKLSLWKKFLWMEQNIEFSLANAWRIELMKSARVLPGVSSLYRTVALRQVAALPKHEPGPWVLGNRVEDYILTLELKDRGWDVKSYHDMISWSDVPLTLRSLISQRLRWYSGTVDVLRQRGLRKHSRYELFTIILLMMNLFMRALLVAGYSALIVKGIPIQWVSPFLVLPVVASITQVHRLKKYGDQVTGWQYFFTATLIVVELYATYREVLYARAVWLSYFRPNRGW